MIDYTGKISRIYYRKDSYMVAILKTDTSEIKFTGNIIGVDKDELITIKGELINHPKFGEQLQVQEWERPMPNTEKQVIDFLSSNLIKGCGKKTAEKIVDSLGEGAIKIINAEGVSSLNEVKGIGQRTKEKITESIKATFEVQEIVQKLLAYGISANMTLSLYKKYMGDTELVVKQNPFILTELDGVGFHKADEIARKMRIMPTSINRINACITHVLNMICHSKGHVFVEENELIKETLITLNHNTNDHVVEDELIQCMYQLEEKKIVIENGQVYPKYFHKHEVEIARKLSILRGFRGGEALPKLENDIKAYQKENKIILADNQREAIRGIFEENVLVLTGGPGTGKTTVIKAIIDIYKKKNADDVIRLAAPTGRASKKMEDATGYESMTIHRLIGYRQGEYPEFNSENRLEGDLIIIDEFSMVDISLAFYLLDALEKDAKLLIVGDIDQLPSVGSGNVLKDIIESGMKTIKLNQIFRQAKESQIVTNAHRINQGQSLLIDDEKDDFYFINQQNDNRIADFTLKSAIRFKELGHSIDDMLILTPMKKGTVGTIELNNRLRDTFNPKAPDTVEIEVGKRTFRQGDKVMQKVNNYDKDIYNGELGKITEITKIKDEKTSKMIDVVYCKFDDREVKYLKKDLNQLELGYALTIHKSQGGEAPIVIMPVTTSHYIMLARNLYYTGITRAKQKVVLIGSKKAMNTAINNNKMAKRNSNLASKITVEFEYLTELNKDKVRYSH